MLNAFAYLGFSDIRKIERMTLVEYELRTEAHQLQKIDQQETMALQLLMKRKADELNHKGDKYVNNTVESIYDKKAAVDKVRTIYEPNYEVSHMSTTELKHTRAQVFAKRMAEFQRLKREGKIIPLSERKEGAHG
ncbi:hypothetical protein LJ555_11535 [Lacticaseibacillus paracasei]|uniref:hypothetical protein n=1 Tax=Lacticaseibacillus paracasei TaxID=1597 RepID=UPI0003435F31|nr:hypothetical protein [Lacticaseibacillus paracasei]EPC16317.1 Phage protein [Lacticaseibacillus paracasei subsp. paracasei Lpp230]UNG77787.1 hypothetical protein LJ555_11535 [Lacticaseibacillus paracasei]